MKKIPFFLIGLRLVIAFLIGIIAMSNIQSKAILLVTCIVTGVLTDLFDGIIARKLKVATEKLRIWDSNVDMVFWFTVIMTTFYLHFSFFQQNAVLIITVISLELLAYLICFLKFRRTIATHSILAKLWTLTLLAFILDLLLNGTSSMAYLICIVLGIISRLEIIAIILTLKKWTVDVSSLLVVKRINKS